MPRRVYARRAVDVVLEIRRLRALPTSNIVEEFDQPGWRFCRVGPGVYLCPVAGRQYDPTASMYGEPFEPDRELLGDEGYPFQRRHRRPPVTESGKQVGH